MKASDMIYYQGRVAEEKRRALACPPGPVRNTHAAFADVYSQRVVDLERQRLTPRDVIYPSARREAAE